MVSRPQCGNCRNLLSLIGIFFFAEGNLQALRKNSKTFAERYVFLLDGMILVCKQQKRNSALTNSAVDYRLHEKFHIRKVDIVDAKEDVEESELKFVIVNRDRENKTIQTFR